jgi:transcriptional regulator with XRE-family HTH domain
MKKRGKITPEIREFAEVRMKSGLNQSALAKRAGVCVSTIIRYEQGRKLRPAIERSVQVAYREISSLGIDRSDEGKFDGEWLKRQTEAFLKSNSLGIVEKERNCYFVISGEKLLKYGQILLLSTGKHIDV